MSKFEHYYNYVGEEAKSFVEEHLDEAIKEILDGDTDMNQFIDDYRLHEWVDNDFIYHNLTDSAHILDQSNNEETDSGLWEGQEPREAIQTQAFFTYRTDMYLEIKELLKEELIDKKNGYEKLVEKMEKEIDALKEVIKKNENKLNSMDVEKDGYDELEMKINDLTEKLDELEEKFNEVEEQITFFETAIDDL